MRLMGGVFENKDSKKENRMNELEHWNEEVKEMKGSSNKKKNIIRAIRKIEELIN